MQSNRFFIFLKGLAKFTTLDLTSKYLELKIKDDAIH